MVDVRVAGATEPGWPEMGSEEELARFAALQEKLAPLARKVISDPRAPQTVVVVPSLTMDAEELAKIPGAHHYEERMLCMLMLLRLPRTHVIYVTSQSIAPAVVDYYLHLLPGIPVSHARSRLTLLSCHDASDVPLTQKILDRPRLMERIRSAIVDDGAAHLTCFNSTALETDPRRKARHPPLRQRPATQLPGYQERQPRGLQGSRHPAARRVRAPARHRRRGRGHRRAQAPQSRVATGGH